MLRNALHNPSRLIDPAFIRRLVAQGGPQEKDYPDLNAWLTRAHALSSGGQLSDQEQSELIAAFGDAMSLETIQGCALNKPHGYAGDFEIIDKIYQHHVSPNPALAKWDLYFHQLHAPIAVRNRKDYFHGLLDSLPRDTESRILKVGIGPGRSMFEWLSANPQSPAVFDCLDIDPNAIRYATELNQAFLDRINFIRTNALRFTPSRKYPLIWAAGIFDYFDDDTFKTLLTRLYAYVSPGGQLVVGNFNDINPSRPYMEFGAAWFLHHRSAAQLMDLAQQAGISRGRLRIGCERLGVNLFLHATAVETA